MRIVRLIAQYFYPQKQTKVMNEGCATYVHYRIMNRLYDLGLISEGAMLEFLASHSNVVFQPDFDDPRFSGLNPYALGFEMMSDIERIVTDPTDEDRALPAADRRQRRRHGHAEDRLGGVPRRLLHRAVSEPASDPQAAPLQARRPGRGAALPGRRDP